MTLAELMPPDEIARRRAVVLLAGAAGAAIATGLDYQPIDYDTATWEAVQYRAAQRRAETQPADPDTLQAHDWNTPDESDTAAVGQWLHGGRGSDLSEALEQIEHSIADITDPAERNFYRVNLWSRTQREAVRLCRDRVEEIRDLASLICDRGGRLSAPEVTAYFAGRVAASST